MIKSMPISKEAIDNPDRGLEDIISFTLGNSGQNKAFFQRNSAKLCYTNCKFQDQKRRSLETPYDFFLITILFFF